jgi:tetratricopeptide (TPR) repeat protein
VLESTLDVSLAERLEREGRPREAATVWIKLGERDRNGVFLVNAGVLLEDQGDHESAERLFRQAIKIDPPCAEAYFKLGIQLEEQGRLSDARELLERGLTVVERQPILAILGSIQRRLHDFRAAETTLMRAIEMEPSDADAMYGLGLVFADDKPAEAAGYFRRALDLDPALPHANKELGFALFSVRQFEDARKVLELAVLQDPSDAWAHSELGHANAELGDFKAAEAEYALALGLQPTNGLFSCDLADVYFEQGRRTEAEQHYKKAIELALNDGYCHARYGLFLRDIGRITTAKQYLKRALDLDPSIRQARRALSELGERVEP